MPTSEEIKSQIDSLGSEEQLEITSYVTAKGTAKKQSSEEIKLLQGFPIPITDNDKTFIEKNKNNKDIKRDRIKFMEKTIELDGLKFPRTIARYDDIKNTEGLALHNNFYQKNGNDYFTLDAVRKLEQAGYKVPTTNQWYRAAGIFGGSYGLLGQILDYPKAGVHTGGGMRCDIDATSYVWAVPNHNNNVCRVCFSTNRSESQEWLRHNDACSLVFLQS